MTHTFIKSLAIVLLLGIASLSVTAVQAVTVPKTIGQAYQGGIVFYVDLDGIHGLIAARVDQRVVAWSNLNVTNLGYRVAGAISDGFYAGPRNNDIIIATQMGDNQAGNFAAKVAAKDRIQDNCVTNFTTINPPTTETCYGDNDFYFDSKKRV